MADDQNQTRRDRRTAQNDRNANAGRRRRDRTSLQNERQNAEADVPAIAEDLDPDDHDELTFRETQVSDDTRRAVLPQTQKTVEFYELDYDTANEFLDLQSGEIKEMTHTELAAIFRKHYVTPDMGSIASEDVASMRPTLPMEMLLTLVQNSPDMQNDFDVDTNEAGDVVVERDDDEAPGNQTSLDENADEAAAPDE